MGANVMPGPRIDELNGLNPQVHVPPLTLSMTSFPPTLPVLAAVEVEVEVDVVLDELPPHAANSRHAEARDTSDPKRFIDTLRSSFGRSPAGGWGRST